MSKFAIVMPAAGKSSRFNNQNYKKPFAPLDGKAVWLHAAELFLRRSDVNQVVLVIDETDQEEFQARFGANVAILGIDVVVGGKERVDSVLNGIKAVKEATEFVAVHDAARPCLADEWIDAVFAAAKKHDAAILATKVTATIKKANQQQQITETIPRDQLWEAQTPQVFRKQVLLDAYEKRGELIPTDEAQLVEALGVPVRLVSGSPLNLKITTQGDLRLAANFLKALPKPKKIVPTHPYEDDDLWR